MFHKFRENTLNVLEVSEMLLYTENYYDQLNVFFCVCKIEIAVEFDCPFVPLLFDINFEMHT